MIIEDEMLLYTLSKKKDMILLVENGEGEYKKSGLFW